MTSTIVIVDHDLAAHLARAVAGHLAWCRRNGIVPPGELAVLLDAMTSSSGPHRPSLGSCAAAVEPVSVGYAGAAARLGVSPRTVRRMVADGRLPGVRVGRRVLIAVADLDGLVKGAA